MLLCIRMDKMLYLERLHINCYKNVTFDTTHALFYNTISLCNITNIYFNDNFSRNTIVKFKTTFGSNKEIFFSRSRADNDEFVAEVAASDAQNVD